MALALLFFLSALILVIAFILLPKTHRKQSLVLWVAVSLLLFECYLCFIGGIFSLMGIPVDLLSVTITSFLLAAVIIYLTFSSGHVQHYTLDLTDVCLTILVTAIVLSFGLLRFHYEGLITYATVDPAAHLTFANQITQSKSVIFGSYNMYFAQLSNSLFIQMLSPIFPGLYEFRSFEIKDLIGFWYSGLLFYSAIRYSLKTPPKHIVTVIISLVYLLGYPLNNHIYGFIYLGIAVNIIILLIILASFYTCFTSRALITTLISLGLLGLGLCYTLFAPPVFLAVFLFIIYALYPDREKDSESKHKHALRLVLAEIGTFAMPVILTSVFIIFLDTKDPTVMPALNAEGGIYRNLFSDFIIFLPFTLYVVFVAFKKRQLTLATILVPIFWIYMIPFFIMIITGEVSTYYYYKLNFPNWFLVLFLAASGVGILMQNKQIRYFVVSYAAIWLIIGVFGLSGLESRLHDRNVLISPYPSATLPVKIFEFNKEYLDHPEYGVAYTPSFIVLLHEAQELKTHLGVNAIVISDIWEHETWGNSLLSQFYVTEPYSLDDTNSVFVVLNPSEVHEQNPDKFEMMKVAFRNDSGSIYIKE
ncbi:MAG: hypothetical protein GX562_06955 [Coriobacteriaceae bacterium]|nr:hypothetical protein [Coriobacteriaceae bacterium]